jgi:hypothetical protein
VERELLRMPVTCDRCHRPLGADEPIFREWTDGILERPRARHVCEACARPTVSRSGKPCLGCGRMIYLSGGLSLVPCSHACRMKVMAQRQKERRQEAKRRQEPRECANCSKPLPADCRADQTTCDATCRQALFRKRHRKRRRRVRSRAKG